MKIHENLSARVTPSDNPKPTKYSEEEGLRGTGGRPPQILTGHLSQGRAAGASGGTKCRLGFCPVTRQELCAAAVRYYLRAVWDKAACSSWSAERYSQWHCHMQRPKEMQTKRDKGTTRRCRFNGHGRHKEVSGYSVEPDPRMG